MLKTRTLSLLVAGSVALGAVPALSAPALAASGGDLTITTTRGTGTDERLVVTAAEKTAYAKALGRSAAAKVEYDAARSALQALSRPGTRVHAAKAALAKAHAATKAAEKATRTKGRKVTAKDRARLAKARKTEAAARTALVRLTSPSSTWGKANARYHRAETAVKTAATTLRLAYANAHPLEMPESVTVGYACERATPTDIAQWQATGGKGAVPTHRVVQTMTIPDGTYRLWAFPRNDWSTLDPTPYDVGNATATVVQRADFETVAPGTTATVTLGGTTRTYPVGPYDDDSAQPRYFALEPIGEQGEYAVKLVSAPKDAVFSRSAAVTCQG